MDTAALNFVLSVSANFWEPICAHQQRSFDHSLRSIVEKYFAASLMTAWLFGLMSLQMTMIESIRNWMWRREICSIKPNFRNLPNQYTVYTRVPTWPAFLCRMKGGSLVYAVLVWSRWQVEKIDSETSTACRFLTVSCGVMNPVQFPESARSVRFSANACPAICNKIIIEMLLYISLRTDSLAETGIEI